MEAMNTNTIDMTSPAYMAEVVKKMPRLDDPREVEITRKLREHFLKEQWAQEAFAQLRKVQIEYMREVIDKKDDPAFIYKRTQQVLTEVARLLKAEIVEGGEFLDEIPKGESVLVAFNHLGTYKLTPVKLKEELDIDIPGFDVMYPSPLFFGGLKPVSDRIGDDLVYVSDDFPGDLGDIHRASGFIHVPPQTAQPTGRTSYLIDQTAAAFKKRPNTAMVNFPEGKTTGKYSGKGVYDLEPFFTGGYVVAANLGIRLPPVAQCWDEHEGLKLKVFPSYKLDATDKEAIKAHADLDQRNMQAWFDELGVSEKASS